MGLKGSECHKPATAEDICTGGEVSPNPVCRGKHQYIMRFLGDKKALECLRCGRVFPIPEPLTRASGAFSPEAQACTRQMVSSDRSAKVQDINQFRTRKKGASKPPGQLRLFLFPSHKPTALNSRPLNPYRLPPVAVGVSLAASFRALIRAAGGLLTLREFT